MVGLPRERWRALPQPRGSWVTRRASRSPRRGSKAAGGSAPTCALVLSGGGNLGAVQAGMLRAIAERGIVPDMVFGCSVGAINGAAFADDPTLAGARRIERQWLDTVGEEVMPSGRLPDMVQLVRKGEALHGNTGLRDLITRFLGRDTTFESLSVRFECVATDMVSSLPRWFATGSVVEPVLASAALPAVFPPVYIDGHPYLDGGIIDNVPISRAIEAGAERIYVLYIGLDGREAPPLRRPVDAALLSYWIARNYRFANDLAHVPSGVQVIVVPPGPRPDVRYDDFSQAAAMIRQGHAAAAAFLDAFSELTLRDPQPDWLRWAGFARPGMVVGPPGAWSGSDSVDEVCGPPWGSTSIASLDRTAKVRERFRRGGGDGQSSVPTTPPDTAPASLLADVDAEHGEAAALDSLGF